MMTFVLFSLFVTDAETLPGLRAQPPMVPQATGVALTAVGATSLAVGVTTVIISALTAVNPIVAAATWIGVAASIGGAVTMTPGIVLLRGERPTEIMPPPLFVF